MTPADPAGPGRASRRVWAGAAFLVLALHLGGLAFAVGSAEPEEADDLGAPALEIGLEMAAPRREASDLPPGPEAEEAAAAPAVAEQKAVDDPTELPKAVPTETDDPDRVVSPDSARKPQEDETKVKAVEATASLESVASEAAAAPTSETLKEAPRSVAPALGTGESARRVRTTWQKQLLAHLDRHKRYPAAAAGRRAGEVMLTFSLDRTGRVMTTTVLKSSGDAALDAAALAMMRHADPVPQPPPLVADEGLSFTIPVVFRSKAAR